MCCIISITQTTVRIIMLNIYERHMNDYIYGIDISAIPNADRSAVLEVCPNALRIVWAVLCFMKG